MLLNARWPQRVLAMPWGVVAAIVAVGSFGLVVLYSAAGGHLMPWAGAQGARFIILLIAMIALAQLNPAIWIRYAYWAYAAVLALLVAVEAIGGISGGSRRWLDTGIIRLQPSEFMKLAIVLALARFYQFLPRGHAGRLSTLWPPLLMIAVPFALVMAQPDLGTALSIGIGGVAVMFLAGVPLWLFGAGIAAACALGPVAWHFMHDYQKRRVSIFLDPASDPLGAGYHITQSKIAIGSGGVFGKGLLNGSQSHLDYLPERHTDFVFATMFEEWGLLGGLFILACFAIILGWGVKVAMESRATFTRLATLGLTMTLFLYVAINIMMVMGLAPVVGIPLPLVSWGGSAMMTVLFALGMMFSLARERERSFLGEGPRAL